MQPLILAIIRNEGLNNKIKVGEVFERAVALYNAEENEAEDHKVFTANFFENVHPEKPETALDMIQLDETKFPALIRSHIKNVLQEFAFNSTPNPKPGIPQP